MGLDISILTNIDDLIYSENGRDEQDEFFNKHSLSRTFCNFMCRQNVANGDPELDQIGTLLSIDISPIYDMEKYWDDMSIELQLSFVENEKEKQEIVKKMQVINDSLTGNIDKVHSTISQLVEKLSEINNLDEILDDGGDSTLDYEHYFTEFCIDKGEGYVGNNFGQDLRNFRRFLEYAKSRGATTVYFNYS